MGGAAYDARTWRTVETAVGEAARARGVVDPPLRAWLVGHASAAAAFRLAVLVAEYGEGLVFATTDTDDDLEAMRHGRLDEAALGDLRSGRRERFFERLDGGWLARPALRARVVPLLCERTDPPPLRELDLVVCRRADVEASLGALRATLRAEGLLVLADDGAHRETDLPGFEGLAAAAGVYRRVPWPSSSSAASGASPADVAAASQAAASPPAVLVDDHGLIRHVHGDLRDHLHTPSGPPTDALRARLRPQRRALVDAALRVAAEHGEAAPVDPGAGVRVRATRARGAAGWFLVRFEPLGAGDVDVELAATVASLERELARVENERDAARAAERATHRELAATHEDALAANQELEATNTALERMRAEAEAKSAALEAAHAQLEERFAELRRRTNDLDNLVACTDVATIFVDRDMRVRWFSLAATRILPLGTGDVGRSLSHFTHLLGDGHPLADGARVLSTGYPARRRVATTDGRWFVQSTQPYRAHDDRIEGLVLTFTEVTDLELARLALAEQREFADHIVDTLRDPLLVLDGELRIRRANDAFRRHFSRSEAELVGHSLFDLDDGHWDAGGMRRLLEQVLPRDRGFEDLEIVREVPRLGQRTLRLNARRIDHLDRILLAMRDVTDEKAAQARIEQLALHDPLTALPNRVLLDDRLAQAFAAARRNGTRVALMLLDLDGFKEVNDALGHPAGDIVLQEVARRLSTRVRAHDTLARLGGDEFALVVANLGDTADLETAGRRLMAAFAEPFQIDGHEAHLSVSSGIALYPDDGDDATTLMRHADLALYRAKAAGRRQFRFFEPEMNAQAQRRRAIEQGLRRALADGAFTLHFQPQVALASGAVTTVEALVRWRHAEEGLVLPGAFIPVAEAAGLIRPLGRWVVDAGCEQLRRWREAGFTGRLAVNLSPTQLRDDRLLATIDAAVARCGLRHDDLELELVETLLVDPDTPAVAAFLDGVALRGLRLAVDDFGRGYSALGYLQRLPAHKIKIDRSFVVAAAGDAKAAALLEALVGLGRPLEKTVVAEGVETTAQLDLLRRLGCAEVQGFLLGMPADAAALDLGIAGAGG